MGPKDRRQASEMVWSGGQEAGLAGFRLPEPLLKVCGYCLDPPESPGCWLNSVLILGERHGKTSGQGISGLYLEWETAAQSMRA